MSEREQGPLRRRDDSRERIYRPERVARYDPPERVKRRVLGHIGALRRWHAFYRGLAETAPPGLRAFARLKARELEMRIREAEAWRRALEAADWDLARLALAEVYLAAMRGDTRVAVPRGLPRELREQYERLVASMLLRHHTLVGEKRTGWSGFVSCDTYDIEALKAVRPSDRVSVYAYVIFEDYEDYRDQYGRIKTTKVLTVRLYKAARLDRLDPAELTAKLWEKALDLAMTVGPGVRVENVCYVLKKR